ncbi:MAG: MarR family transcriptional regulator [Spirochaetales bacterium]|nr:MarR family transcriptional regulator [Spirochaetales bacterium]
MIPEDYPDKEKYRLCLIDLGNLLQQTSTIFQMMEREQKKVVGFTSSQSFLMIELLNCGEISMAGISRRMNLEKSSVTRMVKILIRDGLIEGEHSKEDRRVFNIRLTFEGQKRAEEVKNNRLEYYQKIISGLPKGHVREVMDSASILFKALEDSM